ncbi:MAG: PilN domain-containing protein [Burkholderiaceae bacterium]
MAQQINLYSPILMAPRRYFSALAMLQVLAFYALLLILLCGWAVWSTTALRGELQASTRAQGVERDRLTQAIAQHAPQAASGPALAQELSQLQAAVAEQRRQIDELSRGRLMQGRSHAEMLKLVAQTVPAPVWLTELRLLEGRLELSGMTLQPQALKPWLSELSADPRTAGQRLAAVKLERSVDAATPPGVEVWSFSLVSAAPGADASGVAGAAR